MDILLAADAGAIEGGVGWTIAIGVAAFGGVIAWMFRIERLTSRTNAAVESLCGKIDGLVNSARDLTNDSKSHGIQLAGHEAKIAGHDGWLTALDSRKKRTAERSE